jgi:acyl-CoA synthetase (AMP-forming)/AMP-acid ligase II
LTLVSLAEKAAIEHPARIFLRDCPHREHWNGVEPRALTSDEFLKRARFLAAQLNTLGVGRGESVLILLPNSVEWALAILATQLVGAIPALLPADESPDMLRAAAERSEATAILTMARIGEIALGEKARQLAAKVMSIRVVAGFGFDLPEGIVSLEGWAADDVMPFTEPERMQAQAGLMTFTRAGGAVTAALRSEGQMIAEALALGSVLRLDGRNGLISLMQPGAAATIAASLVLPLFAGADVRLIGPYDSLALAKAFAEAPGAFLYCPDHYLGWLTGASLGPGVMRKAEGILALARITGRRAALAPPGALQASLVLDFNERGFIPHAPWPKDGKVALPASLGHPMETLLPEGTALLTIGEGDTPEIGGFAAARLIHRGEAKAGRAA